MKSSDSGTWSIGEVASRFDLPTNVLRHWESEGLLQPRRDSGGRRRYGEEEVVRIAVILRNRAAGMSLERIGMLLDEGRSGRHEALFAHLADLEARMAEMAISKAMTEHAIRCRAHDILDCPRFRAHVDDVLAGFDGAASP